MLLASLLCQSPAPLSDHFQVWLGGKPSSAALLVLVLPPLLRPRLPLAVLLGPPAWGPAALCAWVCRLRHEWREHACALGPR